MEYKGIQAGRLRHQMTFIGSDGTTNDQGEVTDVDLFTSRAEVQVKSGTDTAALGYESTEQIVTCLMWFDERVTNNLRFRWESNIYDVQHVRPNTNRREMIVTGKVSGRIN